MPVTVAGPFGICTRFPIILRPAKPEGSRKGRLSPAVRRAEGTRAGSIVVKLYHPAPRRGNMGLHPVAITPLPRAAAP